MKRRAPQPIEANGRDTSPRAAAHVLRVAHEPASGRTPREQAQHERLSTAFGPQVLQPYARVPAMRQRPGHWNAGEELRVSDDGHMALAHGTHRFWATTEIIGQSENALLALGSPFRFDVGEATLVGPAPTGGGPLMRLNQVVPANLDNGTRGDAMRTLESCSSHGQHLLGAGLHVGAHTMARGMAVVTGSGADEVERRYDKRGSAAHGRSDTHVVGDVRADVTGVARDEAEEAYAEMAPKAKDARARALGINQYAIPRLGEALAVYPAVSRLKGASFAMHFAGVVARSGPDYVTLENYAKVEGGERKAGDSTDSSNDWTVHMYGPAMAGKDQSFYGEKSAHGAYGGKPGAMVLRHRAVAGYGLPPAVHAARQLVTVCAAFTAGKDGLSQTYPVFLAAFSAARGALARVEVELPGAWIEGRDVKAEPLAQLEQHRQALAATAAAQALLAQQQPLPERADE